MAGDVLHPALVRPDVDVWFYPKGYVTSPLPVSAPTLALVHDTILDHYARCYPTDRSRLAYTFWLGQLRATLRRATRVATISQTAEQQIRAFCDQSGIEPPPIDAVFSTTSFERTVPVRGEASYALHLASTAPHKQTAWLVDAWAALTEAGHDLPPLWVVGRLPAEAEATFATLPHARNHGRVSDDALVTLYREAAVVVVPSEIEGFGLPILEAYASGTPVVFTARTAMDEVAAVATDVGGFWLDAPDTLADALDAALGLTDDAITDIQDRLLDAFSPPQLRKRVLASLAATAGRTPTAASA